MMNKIHRGPVVIALMLASALIAAGLVRAGGTPPRSAGSAPPRHEHGSAGAPTVPAKGERVQGTATTITGEVLDPFFKILGSYPAAVA